MKKIKQLFFLKLLIVLSISGCRNNDNHNYPITLKATDSLKIEFQDSKPLSSYSFNTKKPTALDIPFPEPFLSKNFDFTV